MSTMSNLDIEQRNTRITNLLLEIHNDLQQENLVHEKEERPHRSEVDGDGYQEYLRSQEAKNQEEFKN